MPRCEYSYYVTFATLQPVLFGGRGTGDIGLTDGRGKATKHPLEPPLLSSPQIRGYGAINAALSVGLYVSCIKQPTMHIAQFTGRDH